MLSTIKYISPNINNQSWDVDNDIGIEFENYIYKVIVKLLNAAFSKDIKIFQTSTTRDDGRDIIIEARRSFELFDMHFSTKGKEKIIIYVECKSTNQNTLSYEKFAKNTIIAGQDSVDYLVLVTNKTISPYTYYSAYQNAKELGYDFLLVDQYILYTYLKKHNLNRWTYKSEPVKLLDVHMSYQICKSCYNQKPCFEMFLLCRNYSEDIAECELKLMTDRNWKMSLDKHIFILEKNKAKCIKIKIFKEYADGLDDIVLSLSLNNALNTIELKGTSLSYNFELPLTGENHKKIISKIIENLKTSFLWVNLYGEAGVGKTRIVDELTKYFNDRSMRIVSTICSSNSKTSTFESIKKTIAKVLKQKLDSQNLQNMIQDVEDSFLWTVIIIEDIHNADSNFIMMLEELLESSINNIPVVLITTGRDDYSVFNEEYFKMLEKLENMPQPRNVFNYHVIPLKDEECINLIKRTIVDIPDTALVKLHAMSKNNPFYLIQFIEYLLEIKLIYLLNRNTVGIDNILTFSEKLYIPEKIEYLLNKRVETLKKFELGNKCVFFLKSAAIYGIEFPKNLLLNYFSEWEYIHLDILFKSHFLINVDDATVRFDHESIYLFFKQYAFNKKDETKLYNILFSNSTLFCLYDQLKQGMILCSLGKYKEAESYFSEPIEQILKMDNISSENISYKNYEYFDYIYKIFKANKQKQFLRKTILAKVYVAMHNLSMGQASQSFETAYQMVENDHKDDTALNLEIKQLEASFYLHVGMISKARGLMNELLSIERNNTVKFDKQTKYNLFERASSLYIHSNHFQPAEEYNRLSFSLAKEMNNNKLMALSKINEAKLYFMSNPKEAYNCMLEAHGYLSKDMIIRINCHNHLGILTAKLIINKPNLVEINRYVKQAQQLLEVAISINYPLDIIRSHFLLAILYFLTPEETLELSKKHIQCGVNASVRYGILKLMGNLYNLKALISIYEQQDIEYITCVFDTMIEYLAKEDLLFLGNLDFTYSNIILLTNYIIFLNKYGLESHIYQLLSRITYYGYSPVCDWQCSKHKTCRYTCAKNMDVFKDNIKNIKKGQLLFVAPKHKFPFIFDNYFYPVYL